LQAISGLFRLELQDLPAGLGAQAVLSPIDLDRSSNRRHSWVRGSARLCCKATSAALEGSCFPTA
jgi:hypothetical protein